MALISVTRLRLRSVRYLLPFYWHSLKAARQARRAPGFLGGQLASERGRAYWTVTAWRDEATMRAYRDADAHRRAMPKLLGWCDEASVVHWQQDGPELPDMAEARRRMVVDGRVSKVSHPSPAHAAGRIAAQIPRVAFRLAPVARP